MNINSDATDTTLHRIYSTGRLDFQIDEDIISIVEQIQATVKNRLEWKNIAIPYSKKLFWSVLRNPLETIFKTGFCAGTAYIIYLLTRGVFAGIEVDNDSSFSKVFSSNKNVRLNEGLNLTNGDQAGQFMMDALVLAYVAFKLVFQGPYHKLAGEVINDCYTRHFAELSKSISGNGTDENGLKENRSSLELIELSENANRLYLRLKEDLQPYGQKPITYKKIISIRPLIIEMENLQ